MIDEKKLKKIVKTYGKNKKDTGAIPVQIAILTEKINNLSKHLITHKKDFSSRRGLLKAIARRKKLLSYLKEHDYEQFLKISKKIKNKTH